MEGPRAAGAVARRLTGKGQGTDHFRNGFLKWHTTLSIPPETKGQRSGAKPWLLASLGSSGAPSFTAMSGMLCLGRRGRARLSTGSGSPWGWRLGDNYFVAQIKSSLYPASVLCFLYRRRRRPPSFWIPSPKALSPLIPSPSQGPTWVPMPEPGLGAPCCLAWGRMGFPSLQRNQMHLSLCICLSLCVCVCVCLPCPVCLCSVCAPHPRGCLSLSTP